MMPEYPRAYGANADSATKVNEQTDMRKAIPTTRDNTRPDRRFMPYPSNIATRGSIAKRYLPWGCKADIQLNNRELAMTSTALPPTITASAPQ